MTSSRKALLRYGSLAAATLACAMLAGLASVRAFSTLSGAIQRVCVVAVTVGMAIESAVLFPRKWESRIIIKPHTLAAGSVLLFTGAALILVLLFAGCGPAAAKPQQQETIDFRQQIASGSELVLRVTLPAALPRNCCRDNAQIKNKLPAGSCDLLASGSVVAVHAAQTAPASVRRADPIVAVSGRHQNSFVYDKFTDRGV